MKEIFFFTAITFLTISSCKKESATLAKDQTSVQSQLQTNARGSQTQTNASSSGGAFTFNDREIMNFDGQQFYNSCTNELITVFGDAQLIFHGIYNGTKSTITVNWHITGIKAVGESGREYIIDGAQTYQQSYFSNGVFTTKFVRNVRWVTAGSDNDFIQEVTEYLKIDAEGNITYLRDPVNVAYCQ